HHGGRWSVAVAAPRSELAFQPRRSIQVTTTISRRSLLAGAGVAGIGLAMPSIVLGQSAVKIRAAHVEVAAGGTNRALLHMAELVAERSSGAVTIEAFPDGVLSGGSG